MMGGGGGGGGGVVSGPPSLHPPLEVWWCELELGMEGGVRYVR